MITFDEDGVEEAAIQLESEGAFERFNKMLVSSAKLLNNSKGFSAFDADKEEEDAND